MNVKGVLLDIEGTTSSISFVHDEMFPFARRNLPAFLEQNWGSPRLKQTLDLLAQDREYQDRVDWLGDDSIDPQAQRDLVIQTVNQMMDKDLKATGLKQLQGDIWKSGFDHGKLVAHVWPEVANTLRNWKAAGIDLRIYSSGSVAAQKMFFGHSIDGDLLPLFSGHYDTRIGGKKDSSSYRTIIDDWGLPAEQILFISDVVAELQAASEAGLQTCLSIRPGNAEVPSDHGFQVTTDFSLLQLSLS